MFGNREMAYLAYKVACAVLVHHGKEVDSKSDIREVVASARKAARDAVTRSRDGSLTLRTGITRQLSGKWVRCLCAFR